MKRVHFWSIALIFFSGIPLAVAAASFSGPPYCSNNEPCNNVPGVIWNTAGTAASQPTAQINIGQLGVIQNIKGDIGLSNTAAFKINNSGSSTFYIGNWGGPAGVVRPHTTGVMGDLKLYDTGLGGALGSRGRLDAVEICFNGANCRTDWPTVSGNFVAKTGDTMTGQLILNWAGADALTVNGGNNNTGAVYGNNAALTGIGGRFIGFHGVDGTSNIANGYGGMFIGDTGVMGQSSKAAGFGVRGLNTNGYGGYFSDNVTTAYVGGGGWGVWTDGQIFANNNITAGSNICLGGVCKNAWPSGGTPAGANGQLQFNAGGSFTADAQLYWDNANKTFGINAAPSYAKMQVSTSADNQVAGKFIATGNLTDINMKPFGVSGVYAEGQYGIYASSSYLAGRFVNGQDGPVSTDLATPGGYGIDTVTKNAGVYAGYFRNTDAVGTTYGSVLLGGRNYSIYTNSSLPSKLMGTLELAPGSSPTTNGNLLLPATGGIGFDGNRDNAAFLQLWSDGNFYWDLGTTGHLYLRSSGGVTKFDLDASTGNASKSSGGGSWLAYSDKRLKNSVTDYHYGLNEIGRIQPINFQYQKNNPLGLTSGKDYVGVIAQDLQKIMPEAVQKNGSGYLTVDNDYVVWASVNAIKELKAENEMLKSRIEVLEKILNHSQ